jgi:hypothetical protein
MHRITVIHRQGGAELEFAGQLVQVGQPFFAHAALAVVFVLVSERALSTWIEAIHRNLLGLACGGALFAAPAARFDPQHAVRRRLANLREPAISPPSNPF